ncbi:hypothetical protein [Acinetobacter baumannii]|uniref:hypothetical protein n=1 Tax=Acinetobacter baumannii TaxID=470 RepID=UPI0025A78D13|nr:hypothetical protein [Acinetobacter baumannii]HCA5151243.1 hypothetical protein [Acinetobacter baumannii]
MSLKIVVRSAYSLHTSGTKYYSMFLLSVQDGAKRNTQLFKIYGSAVNQTAQVKHHSEGKGETLDTEFNKTLKVKGKAGEYSDLRESEILHEFDNFHDFITYLTLDSPINAIRAPFASAITEKGFEQYLETLSQTFGIPVDDMYKFTFSYESEEERQRKQEEEERKAAQLMAQRQEFYGEVLGSW